MVPIFTLVTPVKLVPVTTTVAPRAPLAGERLVIVGAGSVPTIKSVLLTAVPAAVVTVTRPVVAPAGITALRLVAETTVKLVAGSPLKVTLVAPVRFVPVSVTTEPGLPVVGSRAVSVGGYTTVKLPALWAMPLGVITYSLPVVAAYGTAARTCVADSTVTAVVFVVLNRTAVAPVKLVPVMVTRVPAGPLAGVKLLMVGAGALVTVKLVVEVPTPVVLVADSGPVVAVAGTTTVSCEAEL